LDYVPMPDAVVAQIAAAWQTQIKTTEGAAIWP